MTRRAILCLLVAGLTAHGQESAAPQRQESVKGVVRKNLAPVSTEVLRVKLPRPVERTMENGLRVLIFENHRVPSVSFDLVLSASTLSDPPGLPGVAEAVADLLKGGTEKRNARQVVEDVAELGANVNAYAGYGARATHVNASALKENLEPLLELMGDVLLSPAFPEDELEKWKKRKLGSLQQQRSSEYFLGSERVHEVLYGGDARAVISPTPESVRKMMRENLLDYYKKHYVPGSSLLGVTGDVTPSEIMALLDKYLGSWERGRVADPDLSPKAPIGEKKIYLVHRPNSVQTYLALANHAIDRLNPDYIACQVLNQVLGSGPASRLFINLREEKGFTYGVYSGFTAQKFRDHFLASSSVRTEVTGPAIDELLKEFRKIREELVPKDELDAAKRAIVGGFARSIENQSGVLYQTLLLREYGLPDDYWDTYPEKIMAVPAEEVRRVAREYIPLDNVQLVAVGNAEKIRGLLSKYGPVEEYNTEGRKVR